MQSYRIKVDEVRTRLEEGNSLYISTEGSNLSI